jgi:predicted ATP-dependent Lon-type protease
MKLANLSFFSPFVQLDVVVFANVAQLTVIDKDVAHPLRDWVMEDGKNLVQHFERIKEK